jgi:WD40 repeat protein/transcriptional regulator with XRE-family HTH domain
MKRSAYREHDYAFGQAMLTLRSAIGLTQLELADVLKISRQSIVDWEAGRKYPSAQNLQAFIQVAVQQGAFPLGQETEAIRTLWNGARQKVLLDEAWIASLLEPQMNQTGAPTSQRSAEPQRLDWDAAMSVHTFFGREWELNLLTQWLTEESCRVVTVLGLGGIGKSALTVQLMHQLAPHFEIVIWRSLRDTPTDDDLFSDLLQTLAPHALSESLISPERQQLVIFEQMRSKRTLIVLDNFESVLEHGENAGRVRPDHAGIARFLQRSAETSHQSCIILTAREKPTEIIPFEGNKALVRTLRLAPLDATACDALLSEKGILGTPEERARLIEAYAGNPLALKIVSQTIIDLFAGELTPFLDQGEIIFGGIGNLLAEQFNRLSEVEQTVMLWLAILREPSSINDLMAVLAVPLTRLAVFEAFEMLYRRSLVERGHKQGTFTLQSVILEYITVYLINRMADEILSGRFHHFLDYGIELTQVPEYVRQTQERLLAMPIIAHVQSAFPKNNRVDEHLLALLQHFRTQPHTAQGYAPANIITLLRVIRRHLRGIDMSHLLVRGLSLQGVEMQDASLAQSVLMDTDFTDTFDCIISVAISGDYWAASSRRGEVRIWSSQGRTLYRAWQAHLDLIMALAFSPDGRRLATGSWDRSVKMWDVATGALLWVGWHTGELVRLAISPDNRMLCSSGGMEVILWDAESGDVLDKLPQPTTPTAVAWSRDGRLLATSTLNGVITLWKPHFSAPTVPSLTINASTMPVTALSFSADDRMIASSGHDFAVKLWEAETGRLIDTLEGHMGRVRRVVWSPDGRTVASASFDQTIWLWDAEKRTCRTVLYGHTDEVGGLAFSADSQTLFTCSTDGTLRVWDAISARCVRVVQSYAAAILDVAWSPDSQWLVSGGSKTPLTLWDVTGEHTPQALRNSSSLICSVGWSADGRYLATSEREHAIEVWDTVSWAQIETLQPPDENGQILYNLAWSPDGQKLAWGTYDDAIVVFDMVTRRYHRTGSHFPTRLRHVAWSPDGRYLAGCGYSSVIYIWDAHDFKLLHQFTGYVGMIMSLVWNADSIRLVVSGATTTGGQLIIWDVEQGERVREMNTFDHAVSAAVWDRDQETLITGDSEGFLRWWDAQTGECLQTRRGHTGMVQALRMNPRQRLLASCGNDGAIMIWDTQQRDLLRILRHDRPYERLDITGLQGFTDDEKSILRSLGAVEKR